MPENIKKKIKNNLITQRSTVNSLLYFFQISMCAYMHYICVLLCMIVNMLHVQLLQLTFFSDQDHYFSMLRNNLGKYDL